MTETAAPSPQAESFDVVVVGGGLIGLASAFELVSRGAEVVVLEAETGAGTGATRVAAGMLAPVGELDFGEPALLEINMVSAAMYPDFVAALEAASGQDVAYRRRGGLHVALDRDEASRAEAQARPPAQSRPGVALARTRRQPGARTGPRPPA